MSRLFFLALAVLLCGGAAAAGTEAAKSAKPGSRSAAPGPKRPKVNVTISRETTYITSPLRPDGYPDYVAALNEHCRRGVTPENNAAVLLWQAFGPGEIKKEHREQFFKMLGIAPLSESGEYLVSLAQYVNRLPRKDGKDSSTDGDGLLDRASQEEDKASQGPWSKEELPIVAGWLDASEKPLALIMAATRRPRSYTPIIADGDLPMIGAMLPAISPLRTAGLALRARAMLRLHEGNTDLACGDLIACHRLARLVSQGPVLIDSLVGGALEGVACGADKALIAHGRVTRAQALRFAQDLSRLSPLPGVADCMATGERYFYLDWVAMLAREGPSQMRKLEFLPLSQRQPVMDWVTDHTLGGMIDWDEALRIGNAWFDRMADAARKPSLGERTDAMSKLEADFKAISARVKDTKIDARLLLAAASPQGRGRKVGELLVWKMMPCWTAVYRIEQRASVHVPLARVGLALTAYRADRGVYPEKLADLSPQYLAEVPKDPVVEEDFHYQRQADGYLLYSVGPNRRDDRGVHESDAKDASEREALRGCDDIAIRLTAQGK